MTNEWKWEQKQSQPTIYNNNNNNRKKHEIPKDKTRKRTINHAEKENEWDARHACEKQQENTKTSETTGRRFIHSAVCELEDRTRDDLVEMTTGDRSNLGGGWKSVR